MSDRNDALWNLPEDNSLRSQPRYLYWDICRQVFGDGHPLSILEIGVYRGALGSALNGQVSVRSYTGIDPYSGDLTDSYFHVYWSGKRGAQSVYESTKTLYNKLGYRLERARSASYWRLCDETFDTIIIDGDHSFDFALWDMHHWFQRLVPDGLMLIDDYDNPDTPEVTKATTEFLKRNAGLIANIGYRHFEFLNNDKIVPVGQSVVYVQKRSDAKVTKKLDFPAKPAFPNRVLRIARNVYRFFRALRRKSRSM